MGFAMMIEMDIEEYSLSTVEDSELIAVLSFYDFLPSVEAIAIKDNLLYKDDEHGRVVGNASRDVQFGPYMEHRDCLDTGFVKAQRGPLQTQIQRIHARRHYGD